MIRTGERRQLDVWQTLFLARFVVSLSVVALAVSPLSMLSDRRWWLLLAGVTAYHGLLHRRARRRARPPCLALIVGDHLIAIAVIALGPAALPATAIAVVASIAMAATLDLGRTYRGTLLVAPAYIAACVLLEPDGARTIAPAYIGAVFTLPYVIGRMGEGQRRTRDRYRSLLEGIDAVVWEARPSRMLGHTITGSKDRVFGFSTAEWRKARHWIDRVHLDDRERVLRELAAGVASSASFEMHYRMIKAGGSVVDVRDRILCERDALGSPRLLRGVLFDVTFQTELELRTQRLATMVEQLPVGVLIAERDLWSDELVITEANSAANQLLLADAGDVRGSPLPAVLRGYPELAARIREALDTDEVVRIDSTAADARATVSIRAFGMSNGIVGVVIEDVTDQAVAAAALRHQAMHDSLTGLANRVMLMDEMRNAICDGRLSAVLLIDLDGFKEINDTYGHDLGDQLLVAIASRMRRRVRDSDVIARLGGDEFAIILQRSDRSERRGAERVAEIVHACVTEPLDLDGRSVRCGASIGVAHYPESGTTAHQLLKSADLAMYSAKRSGGGVARLSSPA